jgi:NADPH:quinone reductase-like Zn-dependent oxidoreductase
MKAFWIRSAGAGTILEPRDMPQPEPGKGEIIVRVHAASLNRGELLAAIGHHSAASARPAGGDGAGEVHAVGEGVSGFRPGDRVMFRARGSFAEYAAVLAEQAVPAPARVSWEEAAAVPPAVVTAYESVRQFGKISRGKWLLVAGASSGVGVACIQSARYLGAKVIGTSGSAEKLEKLRAVGLDVGIEARGSDFVDAALKATRGKGVRVAVNLVGGTAFPGCLKALGNQGRMAIVGYVDGVMKSEIDLEAVHGKRLQIFGVSNAHLTAAERARAMRGFAREILPGFVDGSITPMIDRVFPFDALPAAKEYVDSNAQVGKVVTRMTG